MLHGTHGGVPGAEGGKKRTFGEITTAFPSILQNMGISLVSTSLPLSGFLALVPLRSQPLALEGQE